MAGAAPAPARSSGKAAAEPLKGKCALLVEDSMIIAMDAEEALKQTGAAKVVTAPSVTLALAALERGGIEFALLDLNLGNETSMGVADALTARGIPFVFATGYGEDAGLSARYPGVPILSKPYSADHIRQALAD